MWSDAYYFPCRPRSLEKNQLEAYFRNLKVGAVFAYNDNSPELLIEKFDIKNNSSILLLCEREDPICEREGFMPWVIVEIVYVKGDFVYSKIGSYFDKDEADGEFILYKLGVMPERISTDSFCP